jgi:hypothetical protein
MKILVLFTTFVCAIVIAVCADSRGKKQYIEGKENERFEQTVTIGLKPGNLVHLIDQSGGIRPVALKDFGGTGQGDGVDLNNDGVAEIRLATLKLNRITPWSFIAPADIDNDGSPDYFFHFLVTGSSVRIDILTADSASARPLVFLIDGADQITGLDTTGNGFSDDSRLNGVQVVAPSVVNTPAYAPTPGPYAAAQDISISTTTVGAILCYTTDGVTTPACNAAKNACAQGMLYAAQVSIAVDTNIASIGCLAGKIDSAVANGNYIIDSTAPTITAAPLSGLFSKPQTVILTGSATTGEGALNGSLVPSEICFTWGADALGNPEAGTIPANPSFPCPAGNNTLSVTNTATQLHVGCSTQASVTNAMTDPNTCPFTPGLYYLKYIARDAAGNTTSVQTQSYGIGGTPSITTLTPPKMHLWNATNNWGQSGDSPTPAGTGTRNSTTWTWQADMNGIFTIRINDASGRLHGRHNFNRGFCFWVGICSNARRFSDSGHRHVRRHQRRKGVFHSLGRQRHICFANYLGCTTQRFERSLCEGESQHGRRDHHRRRQ